MKQLFEDSALCFSSFVAAYLGCYRNSCNVVRDRYIRIESLAQTTVYESHIVELSEDGALVLPETVRHQLSLQPGDRFILTLNSDGTLHLTSLRSQLRSLRGIFKDIAANTNLSDELIEAMYSS